MMYVWYTSSIGLYFRVADTSIVHDGYLTYTSSSVFVCYKRVILVWLCREEEKINMWTNNVTEFNSILFSYIRSKHVSMKKNYFDLPNFGRLLYFICIRCVFYHSTIVFLLLFAPFILSPFYLPTITMNNAWNNPSSVVILPSTHIHTNTQPPSWHGFALFATSKHCAQASYVSCAKQK